MMWGAGPGKGAIADAARGWDGRGGPAPHNRKAPQPCRCRAIPSASAALLDRFVDDRDGHLDPLVRQVILATRRTHNLVRHLHPPDDLPEDRVLTVEEVGILDHDEKLRAGAIRIIGPRHRDDATLVGLFIELRLQLVARAAHAVLALSAWVLRVGVPALDHESR